MATKPSSPSLQVGNAFATGLQVGLLLQDGSGNPADLSGNGNNGTLGGGASWTTDANGNAVACTGGGYIAVPLPATSGDFTLLVIHKPTTWPGGFTAIVDDAGRVWSLFGDTSGNISYNGTMMPFTGSAGMTAGSLWQWLFTRTASAATVYVNGTSIGTPFDASTASALTPHFGDNPSGGGSNYDGLYDMICFWNVAFNSTQVTALTADPYQMFRPSGGGVHPWWQSAGPMMGALARGSNV